MRVGDFVVINDNVYDPALIGMSGTISNIFYEDSGMPRIVRVHLQDDMVENIYPNELSVIESNLWDDIESYVL